MASELYKHSDQNDLDMEEKSATVAEIHADCICGVTGSWTGLATVLNLTHSHVAEHIHTGTHDRSFNVVYDPDIQLLSLPLPLFSVFLKHLIT